VNVEETYEVKADIARVWALLNDPETLADCIPGCKSLEPAGKNAYRAEMSVGIGMIRGTYAGRVQIVDPKPPRSYRMKLEGEGPGGFIRGEAAISLKEAAGGGTTVSVAGEGELGGLLARVGQRLAAQASRSLMKQFFDCLAKKARSA
jgi:carbon monoxide dehydrogenase subunit G